MIMYPKIARHCGSCKYWMGIRKITPSSVEVDSNAVGKCCKNGNVHYNKDRIAYTECSQWTKL